MSKPATRKANALATVFLSNLMVTRKLRGDKGGLEGAVLDASMRASNALSHKAFRLSVSGSKGVARHALFLDNLWVVLALRNASK